jgi:hypothetical protein
MRIFSEDIALDWPDRFPTLLNYTGRLSEMAVSLLTTLFAVLLLGRVQELGKTVVGMIYGEGLRSFSATYLLMEGSVLALWQQVRRQGWRFRGGRAKYEYTLSCYRAGLLAIVMVLVLAMNLALVFLSLPSSREVRDSDVGSLAIRFSAKNLGFASMATPVCQDFKIKIKGLLLKDNLSLRSCTSYALIMGEPWADFEIEAWYQYPDSLGIGLRVGERRSISYTSAALAVGGTKEATLMSTVDAQTTSAVLEHYIATRKHNCSYRKERVVNGTRLSVKNCRVKEGGEVTVLNTITNIVRSSMELELNRGEKQVLFRGYKPGSGAPEDRIEISNNLSFSYGAVSGPRYGIFLPVVLLACLLIINAILRRFNRAPGLMEIGALVAEVTDQPCMRPMLMSTEREVFRCSEESGIGHYGLRAPGALVKEFSEGTCIERYSGTRGQSGTKNPTDWDGQRSRCRAK